VRARGVIVLLQFLVLALASEAGAQTHRVPRIGYLGLGKPGASLVGEAFRRGLHDLGYVEGRSIVVETRLADGDEARLRAFARELVTLKVDVIVAAGSPAIQAAREATSRIPIVMAVSGDPVAAGFVASYGRPGANVTGLSSISPELGGKRLELLKQIVPGLARVALLSNPESPERTAEIRSLELAARTMRLQLQIVEVRRPADLEAGFAQIRGGQDGALVALGDAFTFVNRARIIDLATQARLPAMFPSREFVEAGGLIAYGPSLPDLFRRSATYVDRILRGASPAELPIEQPSTFELVVNRRTELLLGLDIPTAVLARADHVFE